MNKWNRVGASYNNITGTAHLWHNGKIVKSANIGQIELLTNAEIRVGAIIGDGRYYEGKISCIQIFDEALNEGQINEADGNCARGLVLFRCNEVANIVGLVAFSLP